MNVLEERAASIFGVSSTRTVETKYVSETGISVLDNMVPHPTRR
jgi:hypothetical protein